jgi:pimeloyl-ACP methyl ester carboxylesterase
MTTMISTRTLDTPEASLAYDVRGPVPTADARPPLFLIAAPMDASGFGTLAGYFPDRTVVTYDPRGLGRSTRTDGRSTHTPQQHADDVHRIIEAVGGPVEMFASSGGAVTALALVAAHPDDVTTLVAHEPPLLHALPDADRAIAATRAVQAVYAAKGWGHGMAAFIALSSWQGEFTDDFSVAAADPAAFGLPTEDDGSRGDPLLSHDSDAITAFRPDVPALLAASTKIVVAAGVESKDELTGRAAVATARALGQDITVFPSDHGGFLGGEFGQHGQPEAFAARLREVLDAR